jgi:pilus assembly protein CpaF
LLTCDISFQIGIARPQTLPPRGWGPLISGFSSIFHRYQKSCFAGTSLGLARRVRELEILGPKLGGLLTMPGVTDLLVNGFNQVWLQRTGTGSGFEGESASAARLEQITSPFESEAELGELAQEIIANGGRHLDQANPFADVAIGTEATGGIRVHAALASGCNPKTHLSIRVHLNRLYGLDQLLELEMFSAQQYQLLSRILSDKESFLISGATGSGKTTLLRGLLSECAGERIIALEDVAEIAIPNPNFISLQTRQANIEGRGEINLERLVREALRMRPDRLVVGEVRGVELLVMLQALNTGHKGAGATIHANSITDVLPRVNAIARSAGVDAASIAEQMKAAFAWIIHVDSRKVVAIEKLS